MPFLTQVVQLLEVFDAASELWRMAQGGVATPKPVATPTAPRRSPELRRRQRDVERARRAAEAAFREAESFVHQTQAQAQAEPKLTSELAAAYQTLNLTPDAPDYMIAAAHKALAKQFHPDRPNGNQTKMRAVNEAVETIRRQRKHE